MSDADIVPETDCDDDCVDVRVISVLNVWLGDSLGVIDCVGEPLTDAVRDCDGVPETVRLGVLDCDGVRLWVWLGVTVKLGVTLFVCDGLGEQMGLRALNWMPGYVVPSFENDAPPFVDTSGSIAVA